MQKNDVIIGNKAKELKLLKRKGFAVPDFSIIPAADLSAFGVSSKISYENAVKKFLATEASASEKAIIKQIMAMGWTQLAIRTSGILEDSDEHSCAGLYDTFCNIEPSYDTILKSIRLCQASQFKKEVKLYEKKLTGAKQLNKVSAVILQKMLFPIISGVVFISHPILGNTHALIELIPGNLSKLVSGQETPMQINLNWDTLTLQTIRNGREVDEADKKKINATLLDLISLIKKIRIEFGESYEFEWADDGEEIQLLQIRPITTSINDFSRTLIYLAGKYKYCYSSFNARPYHTEVAFGVFGRPLKTLTGFSYSKTISITTSQQLTKGFHEYSELTEAANFFSKLWQGFDKSKIWLDRIQQLLSNSQLYIKHLDNLSISALSLPQLKNEIKAIHQQYSDIFLVMILSQPQHVDHLAKSLESALKKHKMNTFYYKKLAMQYDEELPWENENRSLSCLKKQWDNLDLKEKNERLEEISRQFGWIGRVEGSKEYDANYYKEKLQHVVISSHNNQKAADINVKLPADVTEIGQLIGCLGHLRLWTRYYLMRIRYSIIQLIDAVIKLTNIKSLEFATLPEILQFLENKDLQWNEIEERSNGYACYLKKETTQIVTGNHYKQLKTLCAHQSPTQKTLKGMIANPGHLVGIGRVVDFSSEHYEKELRNFQKGEILITGMTRPQIFNLCEKAAGIITDEGGVTSHASVISRELNIPCVVGTTQATALINSGWPIALDAYTGKITYFPIVSIEQIIRRHTPYPDKINILGIKSPTNRLITIKPQSSRSFSIRYLIIAFFSGTDCLIKDFHYCEDTLDCIKALRQLGGNILLSENAVYIRNSKKLLQHQTITIHASATSFRFLLATLAATPEVKKLKLMTGEDLKKRPVEPLVTALKNLGAKITYLEQPGCTPLTIEKGGFSYSDVTLNPSLSSQYLSALLIAKSVNKNRNININLVGETLHQGYIEMTRQALALFEEHQQHHGKNTPSDTLILNCDPEFSFLGWFIALACFSGEKVKLLNIDPTSTQPGNIALDIFRNLGIKFFREEQSLAIEPPIKMNGGLSYDCGQIVDQVLFIVILGVIATQPITCTNIMPLQGHESNRLETLKMELNKLGIKVEAGSSWLRVYPGEIIAAEVNTHNDHRLALTLLLLTLKNPKIQIHGLSSLKKTFPSALTYFKKFCDFEVKYFSEGSS